MLITVRCKVGYDQRLDEICRVFQSMYRTAYNHLLEGREEREIEQALLDRYGITNHRWRRNAIILAKGTIGRQRQLVLTNLEQLDWKIRQVRVKAVRSRVPSMKTALEERIRKLEHKKAALEHHIENRTLPKIVFGGRKAIAKPEWRLKRKGQFVSVGDSWRKGNANTRVQAGLDDGYALAIRNWPCGDIIVPLYVSSKYLRVFDALTKGTLLPLRALKTKNGVRPYTVRVLKRISGYQCHVSFEVPAEPIHPWVGEKLAAIDLNPNHIDVAIINKHGNLVASRSFKEPVLTSARREKRRWLASNIIDKALKWISFFGVNAVVLEELRFRGAEHGKKANRLITNFMRRKFLELLTFKMLKREWILIRIPTAYSSRIASAKYASNFPRARVHQLAALVLGRRALGFSERLTTEQLRAVAGRTRKQQALVKAFLLYGHKHPYLIPSISTDGRIGMQDAKGKDASDKWAVPHTRYAEERLRMQRLSWLVPLKHGRGEWKPPDMMGGLERTEVTLRSPCYNGERYDGEIFPRTSIL